MSQCTRIVHRRDDLDQINIWKQYLKVGNKKLVRTKRYNHKIIRVIVNNSGLTTTKG